jgi:hypothetical protein
MSLALDLNSLAVLRWFVDSKNSGEMQSKVIGGKMFHLVEYKHIIEDYPILHLEKRFLARGPISKLVNAEVLDYKLAKSGGTFTYFSAGKNYSRLVRSSIND